MQEILINDHKYNETKKYHNLAELLEDIHSHSSFKALIFSTLEVDGRSIENYENLEGIQFTDVSRIHLKMVTSSSLIVDSVNAIPSYTELIAHHIDTVFNLYQKGETSKAEAGFSELITLLNLFVELMTKVQSNIKLNLNKSKSSEVHALEINLLSISKGILLAKERADYVTLCDLLWYELKENIVQWKIKATPILKQQIQTFA